MDGMWNGNVAGLSQADVEFLDSILDNEQFASETLQPINPDPVVGSQYTAPLTMDPFTSIYATPAIVPMIASTPLHRGFDSTPNLQSFYGIDPTMTAYQSDSTYDSSNAFMSRSFSVNSLMHSMHHPHQHNTTPLQPQLYQSPQVQFNTPAFYTNTIRNPMMPAFQQPLMQQTPPPPQSSSQAFQQQFTTPQTVPAQGGPVKAPSPPREQSLARQAPSAIRHTRTNSAPLFAPYSRMTPLMLMQQQQQQQSQPDPSVRMTPATIMKLNQTQSPPSIPSPPSPGPFMAKSPFVASTLTSSPLANSEYPHSSSSSTHSSAPVPDLSNRNNSVDDNSLNLIKKENTVDVAAVSGAVLTRSLSTRSLPSITLKPKPSLKAGIDRKEYRKEAEKHRREQLKASFDDIKKLLPPTSFVERLPAKEKVLDKARELIMDLVEAENTKSRVISELEKEVQQMRLQVAQQKAQFTI